MITTLNYGIYIPNPLCTFSTILWDLTKENKKVERCAGMSVGWVEDKLKDEDIITVFTSSYWITKESIKALEKRCFRKRRFIFVCSFSNLKRISKLLGLEENKNV